MSPMQNEPSNSFIYPKLAQVNKQLTNYLVLAGTEKAGKKMLDLLLIVSQHQDVIPSKSYLPLMFFHSDPSWSKVATW